MILDIGGDLSERATFQGVPACFWEKKYFMVPPYYMLYEILCCSGFAYVVSVTFIVDLSHILPITHSFCDKDKFCDKFSCSVKLLITKGIIKLFVPHSQ